MNYSYKTDVGVDEIWGVGCSGITAYRRPSKLPFYHFIAIEYNKDKETENSSEPECQHGGSR